MNGLFIFCFIVFKSLLLTLVDARPIFLESSLYSLIPEQTIHGTVTPLRTTQDVPTQINHINHESDQTDLSSAKATVEPKMTTMTYLPLERKNSTKGDYLNATGMKNSTGPTPESTTEKIVIKHIPREKRAYEVTMPFNFLTLHMPCEFDLPFNNIAQMPPHCRWLYNVRFQSKEFYRSYMLIKAEAFFFSQYNERLRRYEQYPALFSL